MSIQTYPLEQIQDNPWNERELDQGNVDRIAASIARDGLLQPPLGRDASPREDLSGVPAPAPATQWCQFCGAEVPAGTLGYHYGGYRCAPCPEIEAALGPDTPRQRGAERRLLTEDEIRVRRAAGVRRRRQIARRRKILIQEGVSLA